MAALTIGKVAFRARIGIETVRFYERRGLIDEPGGPADECTILESFHVAERTR